MNDTCRHLSKELKDGQAVNKKNADEMADLKDKLRLQAKELKDVVSQRKKAVDDFTELNEKYAD